MSLRVKGFILLQRSFAVFSGIGTAGDAKHCCLPSPNPKGIASSSPGLRGTSYPGKTSKKSINLNEVCGRFDKNGPDCRNPFRVENLFCMVTQGSRGTATLGFAPESRWDSRSNPP